MALICGHRGLLPCPQCTIKYGDQGDLKVIAPLRTVDQVKGMILEARSKRYAKDKEELLKNNELRDIDVHLCSFYTASY